MAPTPTATVRWKDEERRLDGAVAFRFGRSEDCDICLDPGDRHISREAGELVHASGQWTLWNTSSVQPLHLVDDTRLPRVLPPQTAHAVSPGKLEVIVVGQIRRHGLVVIVRGGSRSSASRPAGGSLDTDMARGRYLEEDLTALAALLENYLHEFPRYDPHPVSHRQAAARLGWKVPALRRRIDRLYERLRADGVPDLYGEHALDHLAEHVLVNRIITEDDLRRLPKR